MKNQEQWDDIGKEGNPAAPATVASEEISPRDQYYCRCCYSRTWRLTTNGIIEIDALSGIVVARGDMNSGITCAECGQRPVPHLYKEIQEWFFNTRAEDDRRLIQPKDEKEVAENGGI